MKILCFSDSHGCFSDMEKIIAERSDASDIIFSGDGIEDIEYLEALFPDKRFYPVAGNCDRRADAPSARKITLNGVGIFITHGHYMHSVYDIVKAARENGAKIAVCGHTHVAEERCIEGIYLLNPGSISRPRDLSRSYGLIEIVPEGIITRIARVK